MHGKVRGKRGEERRLNGSFQTVSFHVTLRIALKCTPRKFIHSRILAQHPFRRILSTKFSGPAVMVQIVRGLIIFMFLHAVCQYMALLFVEKKCIYDHPFVLMPKYGSGPITYATLISRSTAAVRARSNPTTRRKFGWFNIPML